MMTMIERRIVVGECSELQALLFGITPCSWVIKASLVSDTEMVITSNHKLERPLVILLEAQLLICTVSIDVDLCLPTWKLVFEAHVHDVECIFVCCNPQLYS